MPRHLDVSRNDVDRPAAVARPFGVARRVGAGPRQGAAVDVGDAALERGLVAVERRAVEARRRGVVEREHAAHGRFVVREAPPAELDARRARRARDAALARRRVPARVDVVQERGAPPGDDHGRRLLARHVEVFQRQRAADDGEEAERVGAAVRGAAGAARRRAARVHGVAVVAVAAPFALGVALGPGEEAGLGPEAVVVVGARRVRGRVAAARAGAAEEAAAAVDRHVLPVAHDERLLEAADVAREHDAHRAVALERRGQRRGVRRVGDALRRRTGDAPGRQGGAERTTHHHGRLRLARVMLPRRTGCTYRALPALQAFGGVYLHRRLNSFCRKRSASSPHLARRPESAAHRALPSVAARSLPSSSLRAAPP